jgi:hypothetical protein
MAASVFLAGAWSDNEASSNADAVQRLTEHPGWVIFIEAVELQARQIQKDLMQRPVRDSVADYAAELGRVRGLSQIEEIAESVSENGKKASARLRA